MKYETCPKCDSAYFIRVGKCYSVRKGYYTQKYKCKDCNQNFRAHHKKELMPQYYEYQSKPLPKTNWTAFNKAQINEKEMFVELAKELLDLIVIEQKQKTGRPNLDPRDMIFCLLLKTYSGLSSRRLASELRKAQDEGLITKAPSFSSLMIHLNDKRLKKVLTELIELSALPVANIEEKSYAVDSSGFSTSKFGRWFNRKHGEEKEKRVYQKAHICVGTVTNIVTSVMITTLHGADHPQLKYLVKKTALNFEIEEISADKAYISKQNLELISNLGAVGYIPFKFNNQPHGNGAVWKTMYYYFKQHPQGFGEHYHKRSNVETTFHMIKAKFGSFLFTKNEIANFNEILCKILAHNICCLIQSYYEFNLKPSFETQTTKSKTITIKI